MSDFFFFSSRRRHTRCYRDWSSDVCSSDLPEKRARIARQTMEIYAPLAERLGIWQIKWELEELAFKELEPEEFRALAAQLDTHRKARENFVERSIAVLKTELKKAGVK